MLRRIAATAAAAAASLALAAAPAGALAFAGWAEGPDADAVVRLQIATDQEGAFAQCTGTAVAPQWVLTAHHCIEDSPTPAGAVLVGQGADARTHMINAWRTPASGDLALVHVTTPMNLAYYPAVSGAVAPRGAAATVYGWSGLGQGATGDLPVAPATVTGYQDEPEFNDGAAYITRTELPTLLQQGDSGGPLFVGGTVAGVLSMAITELPAVPPVLTGYYLHAQTAPQAGWIASVIATNPTAPAPQVEVPPAGSAIIPVPLPSIKQFTPGGLNPADHIGELPVGPSDLVDAIGAAPRG